ncbi:MAG TPA: tetratricopeptide repeat protein [Polyangiaceae bacterium]|nr:tetratricopeptide repeat protein [Polyangiaceae bacterium]
MRATISMLGALGLGILAACSGSTANTPASTANNAAGGESAAEAEPSRTPAGPAMAGAAASAYAAGMEAFKNGDLEGASKQFNKAIESDPRAYPAHVALGVVRERRGEMARALESYNAALAVAGDFGPAIQAKVRLLLAMGRASDADTFVRGLAAKFPDSAAVLAAQAEVASARGDSPSAQALAQRALKKDPDYRPAMVTLARDHYRARRLDLALYTLTAILDGYGPENPPRDKNNADAHMLRALILKEQGKRKAAIEELANVLTLRPDLVEARLHLATFMLEAGNAAEARPLLEEALKYDPSNVLVHLNLGDAYRLLGKPKDALDHLTWVSRKDPSMPQAAYNQGLVYLFSANVPGISEEQAVDRAIESFEHFKKLEPRAARGAGDDVDELIARARNKKAIMEAMKQTEAPAPAAPAAGGSG